MSDEQKRDAAAKAHANRFVARPRAELESWQEEKARDFCAGWDARRALAVDNALEQLQTYQRTIADMQAQRDALARDLERVTGEPPDEHKAFKAGWDAREAETTAAEKRMAAIAEEMWILYGRGDHEGVKSLMVQREIEQLRAQSDGAIADLERVENENKRLRDELKGKYWGGKNDVTQLDPLKVWGAYYATGYGWRVCIPDNSDIKLVDKRALDRLEDALKTIGEYASQEGNIARAALRSPDAASDVQAKEQEVRMNASEKAAVLEWALRRAMDKLGDDAEVLKILADSGLAYDDAGHLVERKAGSQSGES